MRAVLLSVAALATAAAPAAADVRVAVPPPGGVATAVVTTAKPPGGSKRATRVLEVANARKLPRGVAVYAAAAPDCSNATRGRYTALVIITRSLKVSGGGSAVLAPRRAGGVKRCAGYPLLAKLGPNGVARLRCDQLARRRPGPLLLGSDATCIGAVQRQIAMPSPYQLPLALDLGGVPIAGPPQSRNIAGTARLVSEPSPGVFRYAIALENRTPQRYPGVASEPKDQTPDTLTFSFVGDEDDPNVVRGPSDLPGGFACRVLVSPGLPGGLACFGPRGLPLAPRLDFELDFDRPLPEGPGVLGVEITLPRYGDTSVTYPIDVAR